MVFLGGYILGGQVSLSALQHSLLDAIRDAVDWREAMNYWTQIQDIGLLGKLTEIATVVAKKLMDSICIFLQSMI